jgi:flagellar basal body P-ring protein FlgI
LACGPALLGTNVNGQGSAKVLIRRRTGTVLLSADTNL